MKTTPRIIGFILFFAWMTSQGIAAIIVDFDMGGSTVNSANPLAPSTVAANVSVSNLTTVGLGASNSLVDVYARDGWNSGSTVNPNNFYYTFTITPDPGFQVEFSSVGEFALKREFTNGAQNYEIRASKTGDFSTPGQFITVRNGDEWPSGDGSGLYVAGSLGSALSGLGTITNATPAEVRYYFFNDNGGGGFAGLSSEAILSGRTNNFEGTVSAIPEPSTYALILSGVIAFAAIFARKKLINRTTVPSLQHR
ncbi:MAG TPA: hypothetical protein DIU37_01060 [Opitutae bacterium]|nr:hypothetical protein [Opitutae bacterium]|tara:strand:+ start:3325 stop:4083 length:759 start_codon:yes stop_codon:yes gene_type:complete